MPYHIFKIICHLKAIYATKYYTYSNIMIFVFLHSSFAFGRDCIRVTGQSESESQGKTTLGLFAVQIVTLTMLLYKQTLASLQMSRVVRNPALCICENKDADQLRGNREADQRLCFRYIDSTIPLLPKYEISSLKPSCVVVQPGLCLIRSETPKNGFLTTRLKYLFYIVY